MYPIKCMLVALYPILLGLLFVMLDSMVLSVLTYVGVLECYVSYLGIYRTLALLKILNRPNTFTSMIEAIHFSLSLRCSEFQQRSYLILLTSSCFLYNNSLLREFVILDQRGTMRSSVI